MKLKLQHQEETVKTFIFHDEEVTSDYNSACNSDLVAVLNNTGGITSAEGCNATGEIHRLLDDYQSHRASPDIQLPDKSSEQLTRTEQ